MFFEPEGDSLLETLVNLAQIALHQGVNRLIHSFVAHLEGVADFYFLNGSVRILPLD